MIKALIFDFDGTLVETEQLKAVSYGRAARELCPGCATEDEVVEGFKGVVGRSRQEVAQALMERYGLEQASRARMPELGVSAPWQAFVQVRLRIYDEMMADPEVFRRSQRPEVVALVHEARRRGLRVALNSMTTCEQMLRVLGDIGLRGVFEFIASGDDVEHGKPDPEIYQLVARELGLPPAQCLAIEDSITGIQSALGAGLWCVAATTDFTVRQVLDAKALDERWVVRDPAKLAEVVWQMVAQREQD